MKEQFIGYRKKTQLEIDNIWSNGIIFFDTNALLNLYRWSDSTRVSLIDLMKKLKANIMLPHQVALEYNRNRYEVISNQEKEYREFLNKIDQIQEDLQTPNKPPFLSESVQQTLNDAIEKVSKELNDTKLKYNDYQKLDPIFEEIVELFDGKITPEFDNEKLKAIYAEGADRFLQKIPPGYEDEKDKVGNEKYGDLIFWFQIIEFAKEVKKPILLVNDERKKDWWWRIRDGRVIGPRQELIFELKEKAGVDFHMFSSERFLSYGQEFFKEKVNQKAVKEIVERKNSDTDRQKQKAYYKSKINRITKKLNEERIRLDKNEASIGYLTRLRDELISSANPDNINQGMELNSTISEHEKEKSEILNNIDLLKNMRRVLLSNYVEIPRE